MEAIGHALAVAETMTWEILWALILGWRRLLSREGFTSVSHVFVMEWAAILKDLVLGLLIAGAIAAWAPASFWRAFFFTDHPLTAALWGPVVGAGYLVELIFGAAGLIPGEGRAVVMYEGISWNHTTWLNIVFLALAAVLLVRLLRTGGAAMLKAMGGAPGAPNHRH